MMPIKALDELNDVDATAALESEVVAPMLALRCLDTDDCRSRAVVAVMCRYYEPRTRIVADRLLSFVRAQRSCSVEDLARTLRARLESPPRRTGEQALDADRAGIVHEWLDRGADCSRSTFDEIRACSVLADDFQSARDVFEVIDELARSGDLDQARDERPAARDVFEVIDELARSEGLDQARDERAARPAITEGIEDSASGLPRPVVVRPDPQRIKRRVERLLKWAPASAADASVLGLPLAFSKHRIGDAPGVLAVPALEPGHELWFIGDMHGDLLGLEAALEHIRAEGRSMNTVIFLGDLIDDGFHSHELVLRIFEMLAMDPARHQVVAGNHDEAFAVTGDGLSAQFASTVDPGEYSTWLNLQVADPSAPPDETLLLVRTAQLFQTLMRQSPRAIFLPGGLFAAHAGFPHSDLWDEIGKIADLTHPRSLKDFVWNRWSDSATKIPNRTGSGSQFGALDFDGFVKLASKLLDRSVTCMVRGHDHVMATQARYERKEQVRRASYQGRILTINNMSFTMARERSFVSARNPRYPVLARWRYGEDDLPTPVIVELPAELVGWYVPECRVCGAPNDIRSTTCRAPSKALDGPCGGELIRSM